MERGPSNIYPGLREYPQTPVSERQRTRIQRNATNRCYANRLLLTRSSRCGRGLLEAVGPAELLAEAFDATGRVHELLLAGEERMTRRANVHEDLRQGAA